MNAPAPLFFVRDLPVYGDAILAPMDGFSDWPFRSLCRALGSAMSYTEFVNAQGLLRAFRQMQPRLQYEESERPVVFQIYGDEPEDLLQAALKIRALNPDVIDVNLGCPARKVAHRGAGVGMMRTPLKVARTFRLLTKALDIPVTAKMRLGWEDCRSYRLVARVVEENGGSLIAVHGRTKEQGYGGLADWDAIAEVRAAVRIPVIGNGDVKTPADIDRLKAHTGCPAVMIGRAAIGNPWIFARLERDQVPPQEVLRVLHLHFDRHLAFYGEAKGLALFRKHAMQYLKLQRLPRAERTRILMTTDPQTFLALVDEAYARLGAPA